MSPIAAGTIATFAIGAGGALAQQGTGVVSGAGGNSDPRALVVSPNATHLYVANSNLGTVSTFAIGAGGALTQQGANVISGSNVHSYPNGVAISPDGRHLYAANGELSTVSTFAIGDGGALTRQGIDVNSGGDSPNALVVSPVQGPPPTVSTSTLFDNQRITLTTPPATLCQGTSGRLVVRLSSKPRRHGALLGFKSARFYIANYAKHFRVIASRTKLPASVSLSLRGLRAGLHTLTVKLFYTRTKPKMTVSKTSKARFRIC
jgi:hypothetical protein